jgi:hypothetical protein
MYTRPAGVGAPFILIDVLRFFTSRRTFLKFRNQINKADKAPVIRFGDWTGITWTDDNVFRTLYELPSWVISIRHKTILLLPKSISGSGRSPGGGMRKYVQMVVDVSNMIIYYHKML